ncbi:aldehyde dehydrogenase [Rhodococcus sp. 15-725-2-2b]|uniref:aldehyde dehydrogenase family protein n=1 Tax=unclassified Rhodococcus (in: high G+C Gram-positive bacteria) TaxID=192944 RepID=UPI0005EB6333|nr:aldehyde dehydrogenase [Rhodococcus sp. 06-470-2]OZC70093.1 aldehyde dehydrogenase [Rhodococcus sp. 06-469-3-2]OZD40461.1 aldehyde dehydrogenase [Rhodococcus sp. 06-1477-1A]OZE02752.1 aldehyde dehydrogenase [Rhodococcus sp. 05-2255-3C]OZE11498.1 aldehyde dehydrogenase [Rhodococcus sp. 05-2255-3B1]OZE13222.1 aldehyde dehydrogenase [Rhodococcus sp. 05-2255-2A2]OZE63326.1 aldehyde dehydrogenase [Rhodococcus sp. 05-2221-1B]OZE75883.1 aldehyde dehydrogenase [Rhodococcus sp. 15-725-2-2b]OZF362
MQSVPTTGPTEAVDSALADLSAGEKNWERLTLAERRALLERVHALTTAHAQEWVTAATSIKGLDASSSLVGEEWLSGPYSFLNGLGTVAHTLAALEAGTSPLAGAKFGTAPGGRTTVSVLPLNIFERLLLNGFSAEVWLKPGIDRATAQRTAGLAQLDPTRTAGIGVVLGAGNITSIAPLDALYELIAFNRVVALKLNPIMDPLLPVFEKILAPLVDIGALRLLTGGADVGTYLVQHSSVDHVHMTGSAITHDAIVFGPGPDGAARKAANDPILTKEISSELGGVSPTIVLPGEWSRADIEFQAEHIATQRLHNSGYNCVASQVVVLSSEWKQRDQFVAALRAALDRAPARTPYYPGSDKRVSDATATYPSAERLGERGGRVLITDLNPGEYAPLLQTEYFAPVMGIIELPYSGAAFAAKAVQAANEEFTGTLGINIIGTPGTIKGLGEKFDTMLADLRYGTIAVNAWTAIGFLTAAATWGAFPGHTVDDVQSGIGVVHNALLIDGAERTVVRGPFRPLPRSLVNGELSISPKPPWFVTNKTAASTGKLLTAFAGAPSWSKLPAIFASALRG